MGKAKTPSFITELPLQVSSSQEKRLLARLEAARQVYNACLGESLKRLALLRQSKAYQAAQKLPRGAKGSPQAKARTRAFRDANVAVGFREYDLHAYAGQFNHCWIGQHLDIHTIQKLATRAFKATHQYAFGKRGRPRFKGHNQMDIVEGKSNASGIRWRTDRVKWLGLELEAIIPEEQEIDVILRRIQQLAFDSRIDIVRFTPKALIAQEFFSEKPISMELTGNYHNIAVFFSKLSNFSRLFTMEDFSIKALRDQTDSLTVRTNSTAKTYVFHEEASQQEKDKEGK